MLFLRSNFFNTTTQATVDSNTSTVSDMIDGNESTQYISSGYNSDTLSTTITVTFDTTQTVSNIILLNHNMKKFLLYYNNTTTNLFSPSLLYLTNSETSHFFSVATVTNITSINLKIDTTITPNQEKQLGEFIITNLLYDFSTDRLPTAKNYRPELQKKQVVHKMSDGGIHLYNIADKFKARIRLDFVPTSTEITLKSIYDLNDSFLFVPFETTSAWDAQVYDVNWVKTYNFLRFTDNNKNLGYRGEIRLAETTGRI